MRGYGEIGYTGVQRCKVGKTPLSFAGSLIASSGQYTLGSEIVAHDIFHTSYIVRGFSINRKISNEHQQR